MKKIIIISCLLLFTSCEYLERFKTQEEVITEPIVASVGDVKLYESEIKEVVSNNLSLKDSLVFVKSYVTSWAIQQILLKKAKENVDEVNSKEINDLVKNYRQSLYINGYKERLIKQQLDTVVSEKEIEEYYKSHKENFKLSESVFQLKYIVFGKRFKDKKKTIKLFNSDKEEDLEELEINILNYKDYRLGDDKWLSYEEVLTKIPPFRKEKKEDLLKKSKFIQKEDSLGVYLVAVNNVLKKNDVAPLSYVTSKIKELVIHKRKYELIRDIEKTLIDDAIKNNIFKEYN